MGRRNHAPVISLVSNRVSVSALDGALRLQPSLSQVLSMRCRWTLLHFAQVNVRKSKPNVPDSIDASFIGELQAVHSGPWFCLSGIVLSGRPGKPTGRVRFEGIRCNDAYLNVIALGAFE
jgi:hypothetical protein